MAPRLTLAIETGAVVVPPEGRIAVFGARADEDLSALPRERTTVIQRFRPDHDALAAQGYDCATAPEGRYALSVVCLPRAKAAAHAAVAEAVSLTDGPVVIDGAKTDGVDSLLREIRGRAAVGEVLSKAHGKIFSVRGGEFADWAAGGATRIAGGFLTRPGVFSADAPDRGSEVLARALPGTLGRRVVDLGAGWGYLSAAILARAGVEELHLVEADLVALDCARQNVPDPRARFHWADATRHRPDAPFDTVVMNPPFHQGRAADPALGRAFIEAARRMLGPRGELWLVANRHLPYEKDLRAAFRSVVDTVPDPSFKVFHATHPLKTR